MDPNSLRHVLPLMPIFVSASRHLSFTKAAEELFITQGAISQNIRKLEAELGFALFHRFTRRIALTEEGEILLGTLQKSLAEITDQVRNIKSQELDGRLNISSTPSLASKWLAPRLKNFSERYPGISVHVRGQNGLVDFETENVDLALYYGGGIHPDLSVTFLMNEQLAPVCSKEYATKFSLWENPEFLKHCLLIHDSQPWPNAQYYSEWKFWLDNMKLKDVIFKSGYSFDLSETAVTAASQGLGVAIGRSRLTQSDIDSGYLVAPIGRRIPSEQAYYVVTMHEKISTPRIAAFRNWLLEEANL
jgi:LysR family D-serine deaminase transcriptional activator